MEELLKIDPSFNEGMFITKVNNIFIMLHSAIMMDDLNRVRHFISYSLEKKYENILNELNSKHLRQMYDELNVKTTMINNVEILEDKIVIKVTIISRYMDYLINKDTGEFVSGNNQSRVEKTNHLIFEKNRNAKDYNIVRKCPRCGASIDINKSGECPYCRTIFNAEDYDYILTSITTF